MRTIVCALFVFAGTAMAQDSYQTDRGWFVGLMIGQGEFNHEEHSVAKHHGRHSDDRDINLGVVGGYMWNSYVGIELGAYDLGSYTATPYDQTYEHEVRGTKSMVIGRLPASERVAFVGKVGIFHSNIKERVRDSSGSYSESESDSGGAWEFGIQYKITPRITASLEYGYYDMEFFDWDWDWIDDDDDRFDNVNTEIKNLQLGLRYRF